MEQLVSVNFVKNGLLLMTIKAYFNFNIHQRKRGFTTLFTLLEGYRLSAKKKKIQYRMDAKEKYPFQIIDYHISQF